MTTMSVICQNFVQNAWKKDLCSNCFKSVGDHDISESMNQNQTESLSLRYVSQASSTYAAHNNTMPHTTWKSLITERNSNAAQPFKLENGFQGRLLTINKASNGIDKSFNRMHFGHLSDIETSSNDGSVRTSASLEYRPRNETNSHYKKNSHPANGYLVQNGNNCHRNVHTKLSNGTKPKSTATTNGDSCPKTSNTLQTNKKFTKLACSDDELCSSNRNVCRKLSKSKSEDALANTLHSILKKKVSTIASSQSPRRNSNVGFKDEEPLVIGYGGRDFSPEELEWEMNTSDCDHSNGSDSLDETEDDKAFSKATKQNTEFNSDNANLLQKDAENRNPKTTDAQQTRHENKTSHKAEVASRKGADSKEEPMNKGKHKITTNPCGAGNESKQAVLKDESWRDVKSNSNATEKELSNQNSRNKNNANFSIKSEKTNGVMSSAGVVVVEATKVGDTTNGVKNRVEFENRLLPPSSAIPPENVVSTSDCKREENCFMFSNGERGEEGSSQDLSDENEWQDGDGAADQILQAINTSLTNRHKLNEMEKHDKASSYMGSLTDNKDCMESNDNTAVINANQRSGKDCSTDVGAENSLHIEPRKSFLHGISVGQKSAKPSAIYGPASDLFVSRSNSSSSSSSEELGKSESPHSINVVVNGKTDLPLSQSGNNKMENEQTRPQSEANGKPTVTLKTRPKLPAKPFKSLVTNKDILKTRSLDTALQSSRRNSDSNISQNGTYYSVSNASIYSDDEPKSITLIDHYAESNIYQEVDDEDSKLENEETEKSVPRESKLAALAVELEQVRNSNGNTKRQAPAPPKIPVPPSEDPPNIVSRTLSTGDTPLGFANFRGEPMGFSSSSSTASSSSQDTETGYASWNLNGDSDDQKKQTKSRSSFLLTQYSKCKMLALGYAEDNSRSRKKFSLKKLLKIRKENGAPAFDPHSSSSKAWKYGDHFERPRAKLEIIHPMDLENKSVTVNPGFEALHSGSMSSFSASADDLSLRNSVSSDYGSFYSDTMSPLQDLKTEANYDSIQCRVVGQEQEDVEEQNATGSTNSPTPSRSSSTSHASTLTSGSSKNGGASPSRPPKPPPPPRAHSLLPGNKALNPDGTFKFPLVNNCTGTSVDISIKPQAPKRQSKCSTPSTDFGIYDNNIVAVPKSTEINPQENETSNSHTTSINGYSSNLDMQASVSENLNSTIQLQMSNPEPTKLPEEDNHYESTNNISESKETVSINVTMTSSVEDPDKSKGRVVLSRSKGPITKAPARPPPIYTKSQMISIVKNPNPWKTLEDSYCVLTAANRELMVKLLNQALNKRKTRLAELQKIKFQWSEFEIDVEQPSSIFAFGEKIAYHAKIPKLPEYSITLLVTVQQQSQMHESNEFKYPVFGQFVDYIPQELLDNASDTELESMQATVLVIDRSNISTIECFAENLPSTLGEENEKELCFIILQLIHSLKSLQVQGIECIDSSFHNLILAKSNQDKYHTLIFLSENCYDENDYVSDSCRISLCQYALMLLYQMLGVQTTEEFLVVSQDKLSSEMAKKVFEAATLLLSEEKAVSLSQTKTLFECFLWGTTSVIEGNCDIEEFDNVLHRWFDVKRSAYIKTVFCNDKICDINVQSEYYSQFLLRTSVRNIREIVPYL